MAPLSRENTGVDNMLPASGPLPLEIVFSFDTTSSMSRCIAEVRIKVQEIMQRLNKDIPNLRMAVLAHGDYCDHSNYVTKWQDFTTNVDELCNFVNNVSGTSGGDFPECYELVLRQVREELSWTPGTQRSLVMIGDAVPHELDDYQNTLNIDWKKEVDKLHKDLGVHIYSVQCGGNSDSEKFFATMAEETNGKYLKLELFETIVDIMMSIVYRERGVEFFDAFEKEVRAREGAGIRWELDRMLNTLADRDVTKVTSSDPKTPNIMELTPVRRISTVEIPSTPEKTPGSISFTKNSAAARKLFKPAMKRIRDGGVTKKRTPKAVKSLRALKAAVKSSRDTLIKREDTSDKDLLGVLNWSPWKEAARPDMPRIHRQRWAKRTQNHIGYRCTRLFDNNQDNAMYEVAVRSEDSNRKVPVWCAFTNGFNVRNWDTYLLKSHNVQEQIDKALNVGCKLYVRRASHVPTFVHKGRACSNLQELKSLINDTYDYAWSKKSSSRQLFLRRSKRSCVLARKGKPY